MATTLSSSFTFGLILLLCASLVCCCYGERNALFTERPSYCRLVPDFIAVFAKLPFLPPSLQPGTHKCIYGVNLASGGAAVRDQINTGTALFVFGDSLFDPGNNKYLINVTDPAAYWPYGETFFRHPTGRYSDGRLVPDFIADFANLPLIPPYLQPGLHNWTDGANFASAGAGVLHETNPSVIDLKTQLEYFKNVVKILREELGEAEAKRVLTTAVFLFSIGGDDYMNFYYPNASLSSCKEFVGIVIGNLTDVLQEIYKIGGRNIGFQNVGPIGCTPYARAQDPELKGGCLEKLQMLVEWHNMALSNTLEKLAKTSPGFNYSLFDYYHTLSDRTNMPAKYGFKDGRSACCGIGPFRGKNCGGDRGTELYELCRNPNEYVWFDGGHNTEHANSQLAQLIWAGPPNATGPYNLKQLFGRV